MPQNQRRFNARYIASEEEAWAIVEKVWKELQDDHVSRWKAEGGGLAPPMFYAEIKAGYCKDHRFYKALQQCLLSTNPMLSRVNGDPDSIHRLDVAGAPSSTCQRRGVKLYANPYTPSIWKLWVYFGLHKKEEKACAVH